MQSISPLTGETLETYDAMSEEQLSAALDRAHHAFDSWRRSDGAERNRLLTRAAGVLRDRRDSLARLAAEEMGKPLEEGRSEVDKCAWVCEYYADKGGEFLAREAVETEASRSFVTFEPLGPVLAVMPWNFPYWQVFRFAAPATRAGNTALLKHAANVCGCSLAIEEVFREAGFPEGVFSSLLIESDRVAGVIEDDRVAAVTLTGSTGAGKAVAGAAGKALKKSVLELGGSDAYVVLEDADLEKTVSACATSRLINSGQSCIAAKRFIVVEAVRQRFEQLLVESLEQRTIGDPLDEGTDIGPLARHDLRDELHDQVRRSLQQGARLLLGGEVPDGPGAFYPPTALTDVAEGMAAFDEELFGPVASIVPVAGEEAAIEAANNSSFGLGAAVFTADRQRGAEVAATRLEAGCCFVNAFVKSDPRLPFGGVKQSGYGRELSHFGIREFVNIKTVWVD